MSAIKRSIESEVTSNKRIKTENSQSIAKLVIDNRHSFERMGNQLIQEIFYYLPLEDKISLITLNKRMRNCLSESQLDLTIDHKIGNKFNSWTKLEINDSDLQDIEDIEDEELSDDEELEYFFKANRNGLTFLLKTFKGIETLDLCNSSLDIQTVALICNNECPKLKVLKFTDFGITDKSITNLGQTYGQRLTKLVIQSSFCGNRLGFDKLLLNNCKNLVEIHCESIETIIEQNDDFLPKLEKITTFIRKGQDFDLFKQIVNRYKNQLKSLSLFIQLEGMEERTDYCKDLNSISDLIALNSLNLDFYDFYVIENIDKSIEKIAINCRQIEYFRIGFNFCSNDKISLNLFKAFGLLSNVKRFSAQLLGADTENQVIPEENCQQLRNVNISCLKECKRLTHLDLCFSEMTDEFIENIDLFLPNLISIHLSSAKELTDCALNSFIKLKNLKSLKLSKDGFKRDTFPQITDSGIEKLLTSNPSLRWLTFLGQPNVTQKTIDLFIDLAEKYPSKSYRFECLYKEENNVQYIKNVTTSSLKSPNNLWFHIEKVDVSDDELFFSDESVNDESVNDESVNDESVNDESVNDESVNDEFSEISHSEGVLDSTHNSE